MSKSSLEDIVSLAKRRGFIYPSSDIYGGMAGVYDYGPLGTILKRNIQDIWLRFFVDGWDDMYQVDAGILMNKKVWEASGHATGFNDPLVECGTGGCGARYRVDHLIDEYKGNEKVQDYIDLTERIKADFFDREYRPYLSQSLVPLIFSCSDSSEGYIAYSLHHRF